MSTISVDQRFALLAKLGENMDWDSFTPEQVQVGIREAHTFAAREFGTLIQNGFRMQVGDFFRETGEFMIQILALPRPTPKQLREKFSWIHKENAIERDTSFIGAVTLKLGTVLRPAEKPIDGIEYERRIASKLDICLGYQHAVWLVEHQDEFPEFKILLGKIYIDFVGLVVVGADGDRNFPYLSQNGERWYLDWDWIEHDLNRDGRIAVSGK